MLFGDIVEPEVCWIGASDSPTTADRVLALSTSYELWMFKSIADALHHHWSGRDLTNNFPFKGMGNLQPNRLTSRAGRCPGIGAWLTLGQRVTISHKVAPDTVTTKPNHQQTRRA